MNVLRNLKSLNDIWAGLNYCGFSSNLFVKNFCKDLEQNRRTLFFNDNVQSILKSVTNIDYEKVFRPRKLGKKVKTPQMKFMTDEELEQAQEKARRFAVQKLQMPPILPSRKEIDHVYIKDEKLLKYTQNKYVFTDISYGKNDRSRSIVVRDPDGTLRKASWEERARCNQIYFPVVGRKLRTPLMFKPGYFEDVLEKEWFLFILERACLQFEPDDPLYISVTQRTFDKIVETRKFQDLESTRFFGPMVYYLVEQEKLERLIEYFLTYDRLNDVISLIKLHNILHPDKVCSISSSAGHELDTLKAFILERYPKNSELELALKTYEDYINKPKSQAVI